MAKDRTGLGAIDTVEDRRSSEGPPVQKPGQLRVERARPAQSDLVLGLVQAQFDDHNITTSGPALQQAVTAALGDERLGVFLIAREGESPIGLAAISFAWTLEHCGRSAWLDELYVLPRCRGRGVGSALLHTAVSEARALGCAAMDLEVDHEHSRAERLYERERFRPLPRARWVLKLEQEGT